MFETNNMSTTSAAGSFEESNNRIVVVVFTTSTNNNISKSVSTTIQSINDSYTGKKSILGKLKSNPWVIDICRMEEPYTSSLWITVSCMLSTPVLLVVLVYCAGPCVDNKESASYNTRLINTLL